MQTERGFVLHEPMLMDKGDTDESVYASTMTIPGGHSLRPARLRTAGIWHSRRAN